VNTALEFNRLRSLDRLAKHIIMHMIGFKIKMKKTTLATQHTRYNVNRIGLGLKYFGLV